MDDLLIPSLKRNVHLHLHLNNLLDQQQLRQYETMIDPIRIQKIQIQI
jgi:hypothetical protein